MENDYAPIPRRLSNGHLLVPVRAEGDDGIIGDGLMEIGEDDPSFQNWADWIDRNSGTIWGRK